MVYIPDEAGYIKPKELVASIIGQHEKPMDRVAACRKLVARVETEAREAYDVFLGIVAQDRKTEVGKVVEEGRGMILATRRDELLYDIERCRQPIWYFARFPAGRSCYSTFVPSGFLEGTLSGPAPQPESVITQELANIETLLLKEGITDLRIVESWVEWYWGLEPRTFPDGFNQAAHDAKSSSEYLNHLNNLIQPVLNMAYALEQLPGGQSKVTADDQSDAPNPIPWVLSEIALKKLFDYLANHGYLDLYCKDKFTDVVLPHFYVNGIKHHYPGKLELLRWRRNNTSLIALLAGMIDAHAINKNESAHIIKYILANFLDKNGLKFKSASLRSQKSNAEASSRKYSKEINAFKTLILSMSDT